MKLRMDASASAAQAEEPTWGELIDEVDDDKKPMDASERVEQKSVASGPKKQQQGTEKPPRMKRRKSLVQQAEEKKMLDHLMRDTNESGTTLRHIEDAPMDQFLTACGLEEHARPTNMVLPGHCLSDWSAALQHCAHV